MPRCSDPRWLSCGTLHAMPAAKSAIQPDSVPTLFKSAKAFETWLKKNHAASDGLWLKIAKRGANEPSITYPEAVEIALCWGWIDGQKKGLDDQHFLQRFTPRRQRSRWSRINRETAERLIAEGRMRPAGLAEVQRARADGRWDAAYEGQRSISVPPDLQRELDARPQAREFFEQLSSQNRYAILYRLHDAKLPATRARRLAKFVSMLEARETIHS